MNLNLKMIDLTTEQLSLFLPQIVIDDALEGKNLDLTPSYRSTTSLYSYSSPEQSSKSPFTPSPQIAPLESRLHSYLFKKQHHEDSISLKLASLFEDLNLEKEVEKEVAGCSHKVKLCDEINEDFFDEVLKKINLFVNKQKKLSAYAQSFCPLDFNKENIPPQSMHYKLS
ncbi:unnamed protein product [Blepharisma stoltei]|uniref:Uncharacterized protein n=1 Tax=Blepharisma stoltei TaxID=1481888 RepID=A0AAU9IT49_9CILI|nr:unnamed protein product [Blepharisma stoltei]